MDQAVLDARAQDKQLTDEQIVERVLAGDTSLFEVIMRRYNQRVLPAMVERMEKTAPQGADLKSWKY